MKPTELRIGNIIKQGRITAIEANDSHFAYLRNQRGETIEIPEPEPITNEWLLSLGFSKIQNWGIALPLNGLDVMEDECLALYKGDFYIIPSEAPTVGHWIKVKIDYVHQLQNLYFALKGIEIE